MVRPIMPSLGASGGVMALLGLMMFQYPSARFSLIFFPFINFSSRKLNIYYIII